MIEVQLTSEQAEGLQNYVSNHISNCMESIDQEESSFITPEGTIFQSYGPYCGCDTCLTREQLMATFAYLRNLGIVDIFVGDE